MKNNFKEYGFKVSFDFNKHKQIQLVNGKFKFVKSKLETMKEKYKREKYMKRKQIILESDNIGLKKEYLSIQDISSCCSYRTESYYIVDEIEDDFCDYYSFEKYDTWIKIINQINKLKKLITISEPEEKEINHLEKYLIKNLNKCDFCSKCFSSCNSKSIVYGEKHNDNVIECTSFRLIEPGLEKNNERKIYNIYKK